MSKWQVHRDRERMNEVVRSLFIYRTCENGKAEKVISINMTATATTVTTTISSEDDNRVEIVNNNGVEHEYSYQHRVADSEEVVKISFSQENACARQVVRMRRPHSFVCTRLLVDLLCRYDSWL